MVSKRLRWGWDVTPRWEVVFRVCQHLSIYRQDFWPRFCTQGASTLLALPLMLKTSTFLCHCFLVTMATSPTANKELFTFACSQKLHVVWVTFAVVYLLVLHAYKGSLKSMSSSSSTLWRHFSLCDLSKFWPFSVCITFYIQKLGCLLYVHSGWGGGTCLLNLLRSICVKMPSSCCWLVVWTHTHTHCSWKWRSHFII